MLYYMTRPILLLEYLQVLSIIRGGNLSNTKICQLIDDYRKMFMDFDLDHAKIIKHPMTTSRFSSLIS